MLRKVCGTAIAALFMSLPAFGQAGNSPADTGEVAAPSR